MRKLASAIVELTDVQGNLDMQCFRDDSNVRFENLETAQKETNVRLENLETGLKETNEKLDGVCDEVKGSRSDFGEMKDVLLTIVHNQNKGNPL